MKAKFGDDAHKREWSTRSARIRAIFQSGQTVAATTELCLDADLWSKNEIRNKATTACRNEVRAALGELQDGVPFAGPTGAREDGAPVWRQMEFWSYDDYVYNYQEYRGRGGSNIAVANHIAERCCDQYRTGPKRLQLLEIEEEPEQ